MIHHLHMKHWAKHHDRVFTFTEGLNTIIGENEGGKSLILEAIDFALHGRIALRLSVKMYPKNLFSGLKVTINNKVYLIERTTETAKLFLEGKEEPIASGTTPVNNEIRRLLGYSRNVFLVSNYSSQESISYLSKMEKAERKRAIDNVIGLTAIESVLAEQKIELSALNKVLSTTQIRSVAMPVEPETIRVLNVVDLIRNKQEKIKSISENITKQKTLKESLKQLLANKPIGTAFDYDKADIIEGLTKADVARHESDVKQSQTFIAQLTDDLNSQKEVPEPEPVDTSALIENFDADQYQNVVNELKHHEFNLKKINESIESVINNLTLGRADLVSDEDIQAKQAEEKLYQEWLEVQRLKAKGHVNCKGCGSEVHFAQDLLESYSHVPEVVEQPKGASSEQMIKYRKTYLSFESDKQAMEKEKHGITEKIAQLKEQLIPEEKVKAHFATIDACRNFTLAQNRRKDWLESRAKTEERLESIRAKLDSLNSNWYEAAALEKHFYALESFQQEQAELKEMEQWQRNYDALNHYIGDEALQTEENILEELKQECDALDFNQRVWSNYDAEFEKYSEYKTELSIALDNKLEQQKVVASLEKFKMRIKSNILPSVNAVASQWLLRMSDGKHESVELTEDMEILVNNEPIEALSISGRALGHLSLRMALGQVLTNSIFPVFIGDEIDASMRDGRAQFVLDNLVEMLKGSMKQLIIISHRNLENIQNVIEV